MVATFCITPDCRHKNMAATLYISITDQRGDTEYDGDIKYGDTLVFQSDRAPNGY